MITDYDIKGNFFTFRIINFQRAYPKFVVKSCKRSRFFVAFNTRNLNLVIQLSLVLLKFFGN